MTIRAIDIAASLVPITFRSEDAQYSPLRVEPLLCQSMYILQRAVHLRSEYDSLAAKLFQAKYEVDNLTREIDI